MNFFLLVCLQYNFLFSENVFKKQKHQENPEAAIRFDPSTVRFPAGKSEWREMDRKLKKKKKPFVALLEPKI